VSRYYNVPVVVTVEASDELAALGMVDALTLPWVNSDLLASWEVDPDGKVAEDDF
jgi:hypothetical protein